MSSGLLSGSVVAISLLISPSMEELISSTGWSNPRIIDYMSSSSVDPDETSLGIYPCEGSPAAVLVWIHGGGWVHGDRRRTRRIPEFCRRNNILFISINYPRSSGNQKSIIEMQLLALKSFNSWLLDNEWSNHYPKAFKNIVLVSHSSGSHLVALIDKLYGWNEFVSTMILMDSGAYDLKTRFHLSRPAQRRNFEQLLRLDSYSNDQIESVLASYSPALIPSRQHGRPPRQIKILTSARRGAMYSADQLAKSYSSSKDKISLSRYDWDHDYFPESIGIESSVNSLILDAVHNKYSE